jgi:DNA-binding NtrC family response regulator
MVRVNCASIPATLIESELFGREKGAYTGALSRQVGRFELADRSTIFLDEIGDLPADVQVKLLRVLEERQVERLGSPRPIAVDARIIAATHRDLEQRIAEATFREDLYYRLNVFPIRVPPLRERREDVPSLVRHFTARFAAEEGKSFIRGVNAAALQMLQRYDWPGNVRQLENAVFRAVVLADQPVLTAEEFPQVAAHVDGSAWAAEAAMTPRDPAALAGGDAIEPVELDFGLARGSETAPAAGTIPGLDADGEIRKLADMEAAMIRLAIDRYSGRMTMVAKRLGIGRSTLYRKLKELGISDTVDGIAAE